jgi:MFS family permease
MSEISGENNSKFSQFVTDVRTGFKKEFWVANVMELFERIAYYGQMSILSLYLRNIFQDEVKTGWLTSIFGFLIYGLPIFAGAIADRIGFRKAFSFAFLVLTFGYFMIGIAGTPAFAGLFGGIGLYNALVIIFIITAIGGSFIKPSVLGTVGLTSTPKTRSFGYAIYYWLVNIGGALGPLVAYFINRNIGIEKVFFVSAFSCLLMFGSTLIFYRDPVTDLPKNKTGVVQIAKNLFEVVCNFRFMLFLLIFSLYWLMFWQVYIIVPFYISDHIAKDAPTELIISVDAWGIILLQLVVNYFTKRLSSIWAITLGFGISSATWLVIFLHPSIPLFIAGLVVFSIGEQTQAPRFYEYIADLAPRGKEAMYQGFAFLPIAIAWGFGGIFGGKLYREFGKNSTNPSQVFLMLLGVGIVATLLMFLYNQIFFKKLKKADR